MLIAGDKVAWHDMDETTRPDQGVWEDVPIVRTQCIPAQLLAPILQLFPLHLARSHRWSQPCARAQCDCAPSMRLMLLCDVLTVKGVSPRNEAHDADVANAYLLPSEYYAKRDVSAGCLYTLSGQLPQQRRRQKTARALLRRLDESHKDMKRC